MAKTNLNYSSIIGLWGNITINKWITYITKLLINSDHDFNFNQILYRRIFYYFIWMNNFQIGVKRLPVKIWKLYVRKFVAHYGYCNEYKVFKVFLKSMLC